MQKTYLTNLLKNNQDAVIVSSLGTISYDLKEIDHPNKIILSGAMGAAVPVGIGYAMASTKKVIVLVGDGAFLMKLGSTITARAMDLSNLRIIVINNNSYQSCGGQKTNYKELSEDFFFEVVHAEPNA